MYPTCLSPARFCTYWGPPLSNDLLWNPLDCLSRHLAGLSCLLWKWGQTHFHRQQTQIFRFEGLPFNRMSFNGMMSFVVARVYNFLPPEKVQSMTFCETINTNAFFFMCRVCFWQRGSILPQASMHFIEQYKVDQNLIFHPNNPTSTFQF